MLELEPVDGAEPTERVRIRGGEEIEREALPPLRVDRAYWYAWGRTVVGSKGTSTIIAE